MISVSIESALFQKVEYPNLVILRAISAEGLILAT